MMVFWIIFSVVAGLLLLFALLYLLWMVRPCGKKPADDALLCDYAHRGLHGEGIPENSLAAFEAACKAGVGIELDVQLSRDGVVMVFHDYTLIRMTGCDKKLCELSAEELGKLSLGGTDQTIPTFDAVLRLVNGRVPILVELKGENFDTSLCPKVAEHLKRYKGAYCLESFNPLLIRAMKKELPNAYRGLLYTNVCRDKKKKSALNIALTCMALNGLSSPNFIAYNQADRNAVTVKLATKFYRAPRFVWTVRSDADLEQAHALGEYPIFENVSKLKG